MSKQSEAKNNQNYVSKVIPNTCRNCGNFRFEMELEEWMKKHNEKSVANGLRELYGKIHMVEKNFRCGIGGFAIKKTGVCDLWVDKK